MNGLKGIIFDLDGTLVDSNLDFNAIRAEMGFATGQPILKTMANIQDAETLAACHAILDRHEGESASKSELMPGVSSFLNALVNIEIPHGIFTLNSAKATRSLLNRLGLTSFSQVVTRDDAPIKPDPTGLLRICHAWKCDPSKVLYIGDYLYDIEAGKAAGIKTILYTQGLVPAYASDAFLTISEFESLEDRLGTWITYGAMT